MDLVKIADVPALSETAKAFFSRLLDCRLDEQLQPLYRKHHANAHCKETIGHVH